jgi:hypothetical protein
MVVVGFNCVDMLGRIQAGRVGGATISDGCAQVKISGYGVIPCCIILVNPIREVEGGKEIQEGKARRLGAQEKGDEEGETGQEGKV